MEFPWQAQGITAPLGSELESLKDAGSQRKMKYH